MARDLLDDDGVSNPSTHLSLDQVVEQSVAANPSRRAMLKTSVGLSALPFLGGLTACGSDSDPVAFSEKMLGFEAVKADTGDAVVVPTGYVATPIVPWGEPINDRAPAWKPDASNSAADQEQQIGDNHDGIFFFPFNLARTGLGESSDEGLLAINHEYINPEYFYTPGSDPADYLAPFTAEKARKCLAGHGVSIVHVRKQPDGSWIHVKNSPFNRRIHGNTPIDIQGPAAGLDAMKTAADPSGRRVLGTLNNCGSGITPWGTYLTCEENFNGYFGWSGEKTATVNEARYGIRKDGFGYRLHTADARFDVSVNPNEPNRFGWVVEIDPFAPNSTPVKRTALGRFKHEAAEVVIAPNGKVVVYMGCDERNEYIYKFVSAGTFDRANPTSPANRRLLEEGTLYVGKFEAGSTVGDHMGTGRWTPLTFGQNGLTPENGFTSQGDVLMRARQAADRVGATMMDRPEWIAANPKKAGEIYVALSNNNRRGTSPESSNKPDGTTVAGSARPPVDEANARPNNVWGHVLRWSEAGGDASALTFSWDIFVMAGQPSIIGARAPSSNVDEGNLFNSPDGLQFDSFGRLWIQTDGNVSNSGEHAGMGNNQMLVADPQTKEVRRFLVGPSGCEVTGVCWTPDRKTMFVNIQHPGELGRHPRAPKNPDGSIMGDNELSRNPTLFSQWPIAGQRPRSATLVIRRTDGGPIGG